VGNPAAFFFGGRARSEAPSRLGERLQGWVFGLVPLEELGHDTAEVAPKQKPFTMLEAL